MALKEQYMEYSKEGVTSIELEAETGKSLLVKYFGIGNATAKWFDVFIEKTRIMRFGHNIAVGSHILYEKKEPKVSPLLKYLLTRGIFLGFPVAEGETFVLQTVDGTAFDGTIYYEIWDAGDKTPDMENGSKATTYLYLSYGGIGASSVAGENVLKKSYLPPEFPNFPYGVVVPAKTEIDVLGILATDVGSATAIAGQYAYTNRLKFIREREVLFDELKEGLMILGNYIDAGADDWYGEGYCDFGYYSWQNNKEPLILPTPLTFTAGEELIVLLNVKQSADALTEEQSIICLIEKVRRV